MARPWTLIDSVVTPDGTLCLQHRGGRDYLITQNHRVLMNSTANRSELALGTLACRGLRERARPSVLLGGLGMGFTLRAVLDALPPGAEVTVAELNAAIVGWCRGPIAALTDRATEDPRVTVTLGDFAEVVATRSRAAPGRLDAVVIDLYVGPDNDTRADDPLYGTRVTERVFKSLRPGGVFAVWAEALHARYVATLERAGFEVATERPARGSGRFVVYLATRPTTAP